MRKLSLCLVFVTAVITAASGDAWSRSRAIAITVGLNVLLTGDIPKVGEGSKFAALMWLEDINEAC